MSTTLALLLAVVIPWVVVTIHRHSVLSPIGLVLTHELLGLIVKGVYTADLDPYETTLLAPQVLVPTALPHVEAALLVLATLVGITLTQRLGNVPDAAGPATFRDATPPSPGILTTYSIISLIFLAIPLGMFASSIGSLTAAARALSGRVVEDVEGFGYVFALGDFGVAASIFAYYAGTCLRNKTTTTRGMTVGTVALAALFLALTGGRGNLIQYLLSLLIVNSLSTEATDASAARRLIRNATLALAAVAVIVVGLATRLATQTGQDYAESLRSVSQNFAAAVLNPFALIDHYNLSQIYSAEVGHDNGRLYLNTFTKPIPRSVWPEKPMTLAIAMRQHFWGDTLGGVPPGIFGEAYIAAGTIGALLCALLIGVCAAKLTIRYNAARSYPELRTFLAIITPYFAFNLLRSGWDISFTRLTIYSISFLVLRAIGMHIAEAVDRAAAPKSNMASHS